jgi:hypothetical protein
MANPAKATFDGEVYKQIHTALGETEAKRFNVIIQELNRVQNKHVKFTTNLRLLTAFMAGKPEIFNEKSYQQQIASDLQIVFNNFLQNYTPADEIIYTALRDFTLTSDFTDRFKQLADPPVLRPLPGSGAAAPAAAPANGNGENSPDPSPAPSNGSGNNSPEPSPSPEPLPRRLSQEFGKATTLYDGVYSVETLTGYSKKEAERKTYAQVKALSDSPIYSDHAYVLYPSMKLGTFNIAYKVSKDPIGGLKMKNGKPVYLHKFPIGAGRCTEL